MKKWILIAAISSTFATRMSLNITQTENDRHKKCTNWVNLYGDDLYAWACYKIGDTEEAKDMVQETFLAAFKGLDSFKEGSSPKTWLFSILNHKVTDHYRAKAKNLIESRDISSDPVLTVTDALFNQNGHWVNTTVSNWQNEAGNLLDDQGFNNTMKVCLNDLPENWRSAITSKYLLEQDGKDVCVELGISKANYWQILHRAKLLLKECLEIHWFNKQR
ncbi:hypothetical protein BH09BAC1_BH09BAC1_03970 [soil metagenome]